MGIMSSSLVFLCVFVFVARMQKKSSNQRIGNYRTIVQQRYDDTYNHLLLSLSSPHISQFRDSLDVNNNITGSYTHVFLFSNQQEYIYSDGGVYLAAGHLLLSLETATHQSATGYRNNNATTQYIHIYTHIYLCVWVGLAAQ